MKYVWYAVTVLGTEKLQINKPRPILREVTVSGENREVNMGVQLMSKRVHIKQNLSDQGIQG